MTQTIHKITNGHDKLGNCYTQVEVIADFGNRQKTTALIDVVKYTKNQYSFDLKNLESDIECGYEWAIEEKLRIETLFADKQSHKGYIWVLQSDDNIEDLERFHATKDDAVSECYNQYC